MPRLTSLLTAPSALLGLWHRRGTDSLDAALTGAGASVAAPPLARLGQQLARAELGPAADFRQLLRAELVAAAAPHRVAAAARAAAPVARPTPLHTRARQPRRLVLAAKVTASLSAAAVVVGGVGVASASALPGDALYGVKRGTESLQLDLTHGDTSVGLLKLQFATTRLTEVRGLIRRAGGVSASPGRHPLPASVQSAIASTLASMDSDTDSGAQLLRTAYLAAPQTTVLTKLADFTSTQVQSLTAVLPALPAPAAAVSLFVLRSVSRRRPRPCWRRPRHLSARCPPARPHHRRPSRWPAPRSARLPQRPPRPRQARRLPRPFPPPTRPRRPRPPPPRPPPSRRLTPPRQRRRARTPPARPTLRPPPHALAPAPVGRPQRRSLHTGQRSLTRPGIHSPGLSCFA